MLEENAALPEISAITLIPNDDEQAGTDGDSDDEETMEPKNINHFGPGILNAQAEIDFVDSQDDELPDVTEVINICPIYPVSSFKLFYDTIFKNIEKKKVKKIILF